MEKTCFPEEQARDSGSAPFLCKCRRNTLRLVGFGYVLVALATEGRDTKNIDHALSSTSEQVHFKHCEKKICCCNAAFEFLAWDGWKTGMDYMNKKDKSKLGLEQP